MKMLIENIGSIKKAEIDLSGLCVLSGEDTSALTCVSWIMGEVLRGHFLEKEDWGFGSRFRKAIYGTHPEYKPDFGYRGNISLTGDGRKLLDVSLHWHDLEVKSFRGESYKDLIHINCHDYLPNRRDAPRYGFPGLRKGDCMRLFSWKFPENGEHPKTQLESAKLIVQNVRNADFSLVLSHSPYMVEALKRYSDREGLSAQFGLIENGVLEYDRLSDIFAGFCEPYDEFRRMDAEELNKSLNEDEAERNNKEGQKQ